MDKYIILPLFIVSLLICFYFYYAKAINEKLNRRKQYMGEERIANKYKKHTSMATSACVLAFSVLLVSFLYKAPSHNVLTAFNSQFEYEESFNSLKKLTSNSKAQKLDDNRAVMVSDRLYCVSSNYIIKYDLKKETDKVVLFDEVFSNVYLYNNNKYIILYAEGVKDNKIIVFDENLKQLEEISFNSKVAFINVKSDTINVYFMQDANMSCLVSLKNNNITTSLKYSDIYYNQNIKYASRNIFVHIKITLPTFDIFKVGIALSDINFAYDSGLVYLASNLKTSGLETSVLYLYDEEKMMTTSYKVLGCRIKDVYEEDGRVKIYAQSIKAQVYSVDEKLNLTEDSSKKEEIDLQNIKEEAKRLLNTFGDVSLVDYDDYKIMKHIVLTDGVKNVFFKIDNEGNKVLSKVESCDIFYTNQYLITCDLAKVKSVEIINKLGK